MIRKRCRADRPDLSSSQAGASFLLAISQIHHRLPNADREEHSIKRLKGETNTVTLNQAGFIDLSRTLSQHPGVQEAHLIMHGDAQWYISPSVFVYTPALVTRSRESDAEVMELVDPHDIVQLFARHAVTNGGKLKFLFLNTCHSDGYGYSLHRMGFTVVCWSTLVNDAAAKEFASSFYAARSRDASYSAAFETAVQELSTKFDIRDPLAPRPPAATSGLHPAGIPKLFLSSK